MDAISPQDRDLAIRTIMGEEGTPEGQAGIAAVILNRLRGGYGQSLSDVVLAPGQFEPWSARTDELLSYSPRDPKYREAGRLLDALAQGSLPDPTGGATHFYAPRAQAALGREPPAWGAGKPLATLGGTAFYAPRGAVKQSGGDFFIGDSIADGLKTAAGGQGNTKVGRSPQAVSQAIIETDPRDFQGKTIYLSSGVSNAPDAIDHVANQVALLKARGVDPKNIRLLGVGDRPDFSGLNDRLAKVAAQTGASFTGALDPANLSNDRVHPRNYAPLLSRDAQAPLSTKGVRAENISFPKIPSWMPKGSAWAGAPSTEAIPGSEAIRPEGLQAPKQEALHDRPPPPSMPPRPEAGTADYERLTPPRMALGGEFAGDTQRLKELYGEKLKEVRHDAAGDVDAGWSSMANARGPLDVLSGAARYGYGKIGEAIAQPVAGADAALQLFAEPSGAGLAPEAAGAKAGVDLKVNTEKPAPAVPAWMPEGSKVVQPGKEVVPVAGPEPIPPVETSPPPVSGTGGAPPAVPSWMPEGSKIVSPETGPLSPLTGAQGHMYGTAEFEGKAGAPMDIRPIGQRQPQPVGAEVPSVQPQLPEAPTRSVITEQEDRFNRLRKSAVADKAELTNRVKEMPAEMRTPAMQEKLYRHMEDPAVPLTPQEKALYDQHVAPLKREELALWEEAKNTDLPVEDFDPQYAHRIVKGRAPQFDALAGASEVANPIGGSRSLPKTTSSMKDRVFFAIQGFDGSRKLVAKSDDGLLRIIENGKPAVPIKLPKDFKPGDNFFYDGQGWTVTQAKTPEIEANTDLTYYKNAVANTIDNVARLRVVVRAINEVKRLLASPEWEAYARRYDAKDVPSDWREPTMPLFRGWKVQPKLANAIDDFYGHRSNGSLVDTLAKINTWAVGSMFWSPVVHVYNVGTHWWTAKGFDLVTPKGMRSSAVDGAKALYQVVTQGPKYQELLREGSGLIYGAVANQDFYRNMMNRLGEDIKRQPAKWDPIARTLGVGPSDLARMIYSGSSRALWAASDTFMMQRVLELEGKGMSLRDAIHEAERHIPNYRVPSEVMRSRFMSQIMQNPSLTEFSRYHYGMMKSYGEMAKDLFGKPKANPLGESRRAEAIGNFMALAAMMTVVWPGMNWAIQAVTGNKDAKLGPRGAMTLAYPLTDKLAQIKWVREHAPQFLLDYYNGDADVLTTMANLVAIAPVLRTGMETIPEVQREFFSGRNVAEPADVRGGRLPRVIGQEAEHLAKNLVQPYDALTRAARGGKGAVKAVAEQGLGISEPDRGGRAKVFRHQAQQAQQRQRKPQGPLEQVFNALGAHLPPWLGGTGP